jgi:non-ribosomal peptide synthetase component F
MLLADALAQLDLPVGDLDWLTADERALLPGEVNMRAARLASQLVAASVRLEMRVGVAQQRSVDLLVELIAALAALRVAPDLHVW